MEDDQQGAAEEPEAEEPPVARTEIRPARGRTFLPDVTGVEFSGSRRGYDRAEVDQYVERVSRIVVELEAMRSPDAVIERALSDVGEETSAILRRARKAAEEIVADAHTSAQQRTAQAESQAREIAEQADGYSSRVRAEADKLLSDARAQVDQLLTGAREQAEEVSAKASAAAQRTRGDADQYHDRVIRQIEGLAQERHQLIEDLRKLADQFHRAADRAVEQIPAHDDAAARPGPNSGGVAPAQQRPV